MYDLSSTRDTPTGNERTETVPFMAMELLTEAAIEGKVEHLYRHDAESFIWVLTWVCLRYENGKLKGRVLNEWLKVDAKGCHNQKSSFMVSGRVDAKLQPAPSHTANWEIAQQCLDDVLISFGKRSGPKLPDEGFRRGWRPMCDHGSMHNFHLSLVVEATL